MSKKSTKSATKTDARKPMTAAEIRAAKGRGRGAKLAEVAAKIGAARARAAKAPAKTAKPAKANGERVPYDKLAPAERAACDALAAKRGKERTMTIAQLTEACAEAGLNNYRVRWAMTKLTQAGWAERVQRGVYRSLPESARVGK